MTWHRLILFLVIAVSSGACSDPYEPFLSNTSHEILKARHQAALYQRLEDRLDETERLLVSNLATNALFNARIQAARNRLPFRSREITDRAADTLCFLLLNPEEIPISAVWQESDTTETLDIILADVRLTDEQRESRHCSIFFERPVVVNEAAE